ncbi:MAG TPA: alpha/beta fold hydrolase [Thermoleophilaceae bacterium]|nr:alpha/beta fold hydrolase [Thermoleophilaceae bacterium]
MSSAILATAPYPRAISKVFVRTSAPTSFRSARSADQEYGSSAEPSWRAVDWLSHRRQLEVDGTAVNYVDVGAGELEPIVLVHGLGGQWQNWLENIPRAASERRVIALDLPGHGLTPMPRERITISGYGRCVDALCERLELGRVDIVGNSMGGYVAAEVAIQFPERIDQLVLASAAGITSADIARAPILTVGRVMSAMATHGAARRRQIASRPKSRHLALALVARHPSRLKADFAYEGFFKGAGKPGFQEALRACLSYDFRDRLPEIRHPTLIVWGENDSILPVKDAQEFERLIPDSRKVVMKETGHVPMAERPRTFNDLMLEFLAETGPASAKEPVEGASQVA